MKATSGINGAMSSFQTEAGISDSIEEFKQDTLYSWHGGKIQTKDNQVDDNVLVQQLTSQSGVAVDWLREQFGLELTSIFQCGGHSHPRTHRPARGPAGLSIVKAVHAAIQDKFRKTMTLCILVHVYAFFLYRILLCCVVCVYVDGVLDCSS